MPSLYHVRVRLPLGLAAKWKLAQIVLAPVSVRAAVPLRAPLMKATSTTPSGGALSVALLAAGVPSGWPAPRVQGHAVDAREELGRQLVGVRERPGRKVEREVVDLRLAPLQVDRVGGRARSRAELTTSVPLIVLCFHLALNFVLVSVACAALTLIVTSAPDAFAEPSVTLTWPYRCRPRRRRGVTVAPEAVLPIAERPGRYADRRPDVGRVGGEREGGSGRGASP